jgi:hypothetical protein
MREKSFLAGTRDGAEQNATAWTATQRTISNIELRTFLRRAGMKEKLKNESDTWTCVVRYDGRPSR